MAEFFGWEFKRKKQTEPQTPIVKEDDDGAVVINAGGYANVFVDQAGTNNSEAALIQKYRQTALAPEVDAAIEEIVNEFIDIEEDEPVTIDFIKNKLDEKTEKLLIDEFNEVLRLLDFRLSCFNIVRRWYIDGRIKYHVLIDEKNPGNGIQELRYVDPRKLRKVREVTKERIDSKDNQNNQLFKKVYKEYYIYNEKGFTSANTSFSGATTGVKISKDSIVDVPSGLMDMNNTMVLSYLDKAIKPLNQLKTLEDASIIYTLARAPERRIWYIDVAGLPVAKAEQHLQNQMRLHKNKLSYDPSTGDIKAQTKFITMLEDYWLPRRGEQGKGTEVTTLPAGANFDKTQQMEYFQKNLYKSLNVPVNRLNENDTFVLGRATQITRDEVKFSKFIARLRNQLSNLFYDSMEKNVILKGVMTKEQWDLLKPFINFVWESASYFDELKQGEILNDRLNAMNNIQPFIGTFYSKEWVQKNVLHQSEEQIEEMNLQIEQEAAMDNYGNEDQPQDSEQNPNQEQDSSDQEQEDSGNDPVEAKKQKLLNARTVYNKLKDKENKTLKEMMIYRSASQIISRNKTADKKV